MTASIGKNLQIAGQMGYEYDPSSDTFSQGNTVMAGDNVRWLAQEADRVKAQRMTVDGDTMTHDTEPREATGYDRRHEQLEREQQWKQREEELSHMREQCRIAGEELKRVQDENLYLRGQVDAYKFELGAE
jgi:hypothetical protein